MINLINFDNFKKDAPDFYRWSKHLFKDNKRCIITKTSSCWQIKFKSTNYSYHFAIAPSTKSYAGFIGCTALPGYNTLVSEKCLVYNKKSWDLIMMEIVKLEMST